MADFTFKLDDEIRADGKLMAGCTKCGKVAHVKISLDANRPAIAEASKRLNHWSRYHRLGDPKPTGPGVEEQAPVFIPPESWKQRILKRVADMLRRGLITIEGYDD